MAAVSKKHEWAVASNVELVQRQRRSARLDAGRGAKRAQDCDVACRKFRRAHPAVRLGECFSLVFFVGALKNARHARQFEHAGAG
jgi:hypothetical protein